MFKLLKLIIYLGIIVVLILAGLYFYSSLNPECLKEGDQETIAENDKIDALIDIFVSDNINKAIDGVDIKMDKDKIKETVKDKIKEMLNDNKEELFDDWQDKVSSFVEEAVNNSEEVGAENKRVDDYKYPWDDAEKFENISIGKCKPGYIWESKARIGCVQINCYEVVNAFWNEVGSCVCGETDFEKDNQADVATECYQGADFSDCPGCVFKCIKNNEVCN